MTAPFTIRRMTRADKPAMLEISSLVWEGSDYIPRVFDEWVDDTEGEFAAVSLDGRLVGCGKLTFLAPGHAWLEGMRKDPRVTQKGMAVALGRYFIDTLQGRPGLASVRFSTYLFNEASIAANERLGFRRRAVYSLKAWDGSLAVARARAGSELPVLRDPAAVQARVEAAGTVAADGVVVEGWRVYPYSRELVTARYVDTGACRGSAGLSILTLVRGTDRTMGRLVHFDAPGPAEAADLAADLFARAARFMDVSGSDRLEIEWMVPRDGRLLSLAGTLGFRSWKQEDDFLLYELPLAGRGGQP